jgi:predicted HicB family RNase H-like nuclease
VTTKDYVSNTMKIPIVLHRAAKSEAALEGVSLQAWIVEAIRLRVESLAERRRNDTK